MQRAVVTQTSYAQWQYRSIKQFRPDLPFWLDLCLQQCSQADPKSRYQAFSELEVSLNKPDTTALAEYKKRPLIERNPVMFWQSTSLILFILLLSALAQ